MKRGRPRAVPFFTKTAMDIKDIFTLYDARSPMRYDLSDHSRGLSDFRQIVIAEWGDLRLVIKIAHNAFTTPPRVEGWRQAIEAYRSIGCYCPRIIPNRKGKFTEAVEYHGLPCVVFAEEYSVYRTAEQFDQRRIWKDGRRVYQEAALRLTAQAGAQRWSFVDFPSAYCILEPFDPSEDDDEVMECALCVKKMMETDFPEQRNRFQRIWNAFLENKAALSRVYQQLPTSVFQADMGGGNVLLDEDLRLAGVLDFNLSGRETALNMLFRESFVNFEDKEKNMLYDGGLQEKAFALFLENLKIIKKHYTFNQAEADAAPLLYRYLRPFWWYTVRAVETNRKDAAKIERVLAWMEAEQARKLEL